MVTKKQRLRLITSAFLDVVNDFKESYIKSEEDIRMSFYYNSRNKFKRRKINNYKIVGDECIPPKSCKYKPDLIIYADNTRCCAIEIKYIRKADSITKAIRDINKLKYYTKRGIYWSSAFFIHIDEYDKDDLFEKYRQTYEDWKDNFIELWYVAEDLNGEEGAYMNCYSRKKARRRKLL